jgi:hypothetical protein
MNVHENVHENVTFLRARRAVDEHERANRP